MKMQYSEIDQSDLDSSADQQGPVLEATNTTKLLLVAVYHEKMSGSVSTPSI